LMKFRVGISLINKVYFFSCNILSNIIKIKLEYIPL
jgi:hypothetical protein